MFNREIFKNQVGYGEFLILKGDFYSHSRKVWSSLCYCYGHAIVGMATVNYTAEAAESSVEGHLNTRAIDMTSQSEMDKLLSYWLKLHFDGLLSSACPPFGFGLRHIETTACVKIQLVYITRFDEF